MGVLTDIFTGGASKAAGGGGGGLFGKATEMYKKRKNKRDRAKMDTGIATEDERPSKRPGGKRSDSYDY